VWLVLAAGAALSILAALVVLHRTTAPAPTVTLGGDPRLVTDRRENVRRSGWTIIDVDGDASTPPLSYTVGMGGRGRPDLLLIWDADKAARAAMLGAVAETLVKRRGPLPNHFEPLGPGRVRLNRVYDEKFFERCPLASSWNALHGVKKGGGLQIVFADANGRYPD
jgi:hypothetical protein